MSLGCASVLRLSDYVVVWFVTLFALAVCLGVVVVVVCCCCLLVCVLVVFVCVRCLLRFVLCVCLCRFVG